MPRCKIDLLEALAVVALDRNLGPELDPRLFELLTILTVTEGAVGQHLAHFGLKRPARLLRQLQRALVVRRAPRQASTAVIGWLSTSVAMSSLWPSKRWLALFRPCRIADRQCCRSAPARLSLDRHLLRALQG